MKLKKIIRVLEIVSYLKVKIFVLCLRHPSCKMQLDEYSIYGVLLRSFFSLSFLCSFRHSTNYVHPIRSLVAFLPALRRVSLAPASPPSRSHAHKGPIYKIAQVRHTRKFKKRSLVKSLKIGLLCSHARPGVGMEL